MELVLIAVAALIIIAVALLAVGHAVGTTEAMPAQIVIDSHEAIEFCAQALPGWVTASLSYDDLRRLLRLHLEWIQAYHWAPASGDVTPIIFEQFDPLAYVMERCQNVGLEVTAEEAAAVIQAHSDYLQVVGALHLDDPVDVEADLAQFPLLEGADRAQLFASPEDSRSVDEPSTDGPPGGVASDKDPGDRSGDRPGRRTDGSTDDD
ncbi:MAG: hypothetical protein OER95_06130 [Acidimicrobiia bacterium]|nr:hypothetical protein [Acidimicrobiia bacterium]